MVILDNVCGLKEESHKLVEVECDYKVSISCKKQWTLQYRDARKTLDRNGGKIICLYCSRRLKTSGRSNPNCRHKSINDNFFSVVDTKEKAYLLGWLASDGSLGKNGTISISLHKKDEAVLIKLKDIIDSSLEIKTVKGTQRGFSIHSVRMVESLCNLLKLKGPGKKSSSVRFPDLAEKFKWEFLRGYFEGDGYIIDPNKNKKRSLSCGIDSNSRLMLQDIVSFVKIPCNLGKTKIEWYGNNALDFLEKLYKDCENRFLDRKRELYFHWTYWIPALGGGRGKYNGYFPCFKWQAARKDAVAPSKVRASDSGYDLFLLEKIKTAGQLEIYDTGIKVQPEYGWYCMLVPRSSIIKSGYMLANGVGIIDRTYLGSVKVALWKIDKNAPDLELPNRLVQLIPTPIIHFQLIEVDSLDDTERGEKGFGSTGK